MRSTKMQTLGSYLKETREKLKLKLRVIEEMVGISNAYLSQLENNKIANPSPTVLHKLAKCYGLSYSRLMELAGYPAVDEATVQRRAAASHPRLGELTTDEEEKLREYLTFLRSRRQSK